MADHLFPKVECAWTRSSSSSLVQHSLRMLGCKWFTHLSLHCLPDRSVNFLLSPNNNNRNRHTHTHTHYTYSFHCIAAYPVHRNQNCIVWTFKHQHQIRQEPFNETHTQKLFMKKLKSKNTEKKKPKKQKKMMMMMMMMKMVITKKTKRALQLARWCKRRLTHLPGTWRWGTSVWFHNASPIY